MELDVYKLVVDNIFNLPIGSVVSKDNDGFTLLYGLNSPELNDNKLPIKLVVDFPQYWQKAKLFTEDGEYLFGDETCYYVRINNIINDPKIPPYVMKRRNCNGRATSGKYFYYKDNALKYIQDNLKLISEKKDLLYYGLLTKGTWEYRELPYSHTKQHSSAWVWFKTKQERNEYENENKPMYSKNDIKNFLKQINLVDAVNDIDEFLNS